MVKTMSGTMLLIPVLAVLLVSGDAMSCTVCHSKDPKMVRMHEALEFKDCFVCHGPAAKRSQDTPQQQMRTDILCARCHGSAALTGTEPQPSHEAVRP